MQTWEQTLAQYQAELAAVEQRIADIKDKKKSIADGHRLALLKASRLSLISDISDVQEVLRRGSG